MKKIYYLLTMVLLLVLCVVPTTTQAATLPDSKKVKSIEVNKTITGSFTLKNNDSKWYSFKTGSKEEFYRIEAKNSASTRGITIFLLHYEKDKKLEYTCTNPISLSVKANSSDQSDAVLLDKNTTYYVQINGQTTREEQSFAFNFKVSKLQDKVGNTFKDASSLTLGKQKSSSIDFENDVDYWKFKTGKDTDYKFTVENNAKDKTYLYVELYDSSKKTVKLGKDILTVKTSTKVSEITLALKTKATYYLKISSRGGSADYTLKMEQIKDDYADKYTGATAIKADKAYKGLIGSVSDTDWLKFTPTQTGDYDIIKTSDSGASVICEVYLVNKKGKLTEIYKRYDRENRDA